MSNPINHHYVSQCQIRNFFNNADGKIYLYDKEIYNNFNTRSTKRIFSEDHLNSRLRDGKIDTSTLESNLNNSVEKMFSKCYDLLAHAIEKGVIPSNIQEIVIGLLKYGIAGEIRTPYHKKETDNAISNVFNTILDSATPDLKKSYYDEFAEIHQHHTAT